MNNLECVCQGNWRLLVNEYEHLIGRKYKAVRDGKEDEYVFFGLIHASDDYYFGMCKISDNTTIMLSCVGCPETFGFTLIE